jgi:hypothetical protein
VSCPIDLAQLAPNQWGKHATENNELVRFVSIAVTTHYRWRKALEQ